MATSITFEIAAELKQIEERIFQLEERVAELEGELTLGSLVDKLKEANKKASDRINPMLNPDEF